MLRYLVSLNEVSDKNLEKKVIDICKESGIDLNPYDIEAWYRLTSGRVNTSNSNHVIVKGYLCYKTILCHKLALDV